MNCTCNNFGRFADGTCRACRRATRIAMEAERRALRTRPAARPGPNDFEDYEPCANGRLLAGSR